MINVRQLRLENWIYVPVKDAMKDGTWRDGVNQVEVTSIDEDGSLGTTAYFHNGMGCTGTTCNDAIPIALTPEILTEWCGFEKREQAEGGFSFRSDMSYVIVFDEGKFTLWYYNEYEEREIKYLHDLQNLYYAVNFRELEIKIPDTT